MLEEKPKLISRREFGRIALSSVLLLMLPLDAISDTKKKDDKKGNDHKPKPKIHSDSGKQHEDHHDPKKPIVHNWLHINQGQPVPNGGAGLQIAPNGHWQFTGHLFNPESQQFRIVLMFGVKSSTGTLYTFQVLNDIAGSFGEGNQLYQWDRHGKSEALRKAWNDLIKAHDWCAQSLMQEATIMGGFINNGGFNPEALLSNVENRLNAVGPVVAICQ